MSANGTTSWFRFGIMALPVAGLLHGLAYLLPLAGPERDAGANPTERAQFLTSTSWFLGTFSPAVGLALLMLGMIALAAYLANTRGRAWATAGLALGVLGIALYLPFRGILAFAMPAAGRAYLEGNPGGSEMVRVIEAAGFNPIVIGASFLLWGSFVAFGVAVWRSRTLPGWAAVLLALDGLLLHGPLFGIRIAGVPAVSIIGALLLTLGGGWLAMIVLRATPARQLGGESQGGAAPSSAGPVVEPLS